MEVFLNGKFASVFANINGLHNNILTQVWLITNCLESMSQAASKELSAFREELKQVIQEEKETLQNITVKKLDELWLLTDCLQMRISDLEMKLSSLKLPELEAEESGNGLIQWMA